MSGANNANTVSGANKANTVTKLLVANRGEIARRIFRTARAMGIASVAVFSDSDADAPHVAEADEAVHLVGLSPTDTYLSIEKVLAAAALTGADAVHPGYGFLSENAAFARACAAAGLTFIGPSPEAIDAMGSKIEAKKMMAAAGVPILGAEGFPLLVKAAFGGGGRGMRIVRTEGELGEALASAEREAAAAFGDGTVFVERYVDNPRHIEVQIFGDTHGNVIHLFERECSIQRRYQKIVEEAPSPTVNASLRAALCEAAVQAGRALQYVGAGTVEFVLAPNGEFFFLEINTRLQVEHPVTEAVTGLDLVELQIRVARGEALTIQPSITGWAMEARLYAEDVAAGFVPVSGRIEYLSIPSGPGVRVDSGYETGSTVSTHFDAMLAKVIAVGDTRSQAIERLRQALADARIHGISTNRELLVKILAHEEYRAGTIDTGFLDRHPDLLQQSVAAAPIHAVVAALADQARRRAAAAVQPNVPSGWRNVAASLQFCEYATSQRTYRVGYGLLRSGLVVEVDGVALADAVLWSATADSIDITIACVRRRYTIGRSGSNRYVDGPDGSSVLTVVPRLPISAVASQPGSMLAPLPGSVVRVLAAPGDVVVAGQPIVVLEAMKMEHSVVSSHSGRLSELLVVVGQQVQGGDVLAVIESLEDGQ